MVAVTSKKTGNEVSVTWHYLNTSTLVLDFKFPAKKKIHRRIAKIAYFRHSDKEEASSIVSSCFADRQINYEENREIIKKPKSSAPVTKFVSEGLHSRHS
ncbi:hypothetical protein OUZ56_006963 [Daphnia magna]|uniref:Uncharacterized protein n=1 Tax=Daphnia magna TaxID=35525 RepID=A0ABQ9YX77_9CRUS|nr:hypothetical protein OUZ56_006963 [Daphnia magna]